MNTIGFPGLGLSFTIDPVAFTLFGLEVRWYGIILTLGIIAAFTYFYFRATRTEHLNPDHLYNLALFTVPLGIIGARFIYVVTKWEDYKGDFLKMIDIRSGGLAIYGAIIFGAITVITYCLITKIGTFKVLDALGPGVMLGQLIGRWGNFVNAEAFGSSKNVGNLFCRMEINGECYHPTFLYESLWNLLGFLLINLIFYRRKKFDGEIFFLYIGWYGFGRAWIELLRTDSLYIDKAEKIKFSVVVGILSVIACVVALIVLSVRHKKAVQEEQAPVAYTAKFARASVAVDPAADAQEPAGEETPAAAPDPSDEETMPGEEAAPESETAPGEQAAPEGETAPGEDSAPGEEAAPEGGSGAE